MTRCRFRLVRATIVATFLGGVTPILSAQSVEIAPIAGYRFGGDFFERISGRPVDLDGAPALGGVIDVPMSDGLQFEGLFTHQHAHVLVAPGPLTPATRWRMSVDHWQAGGLQEFSRGRLRPFLTGTLGLTRYAVEGDNEVRFALGAGGGTKLFPTDHIGVRLDGRLFATFVDTDGSVLCSFGRCFLGVRASVVWQAEFTAGVVFAFP